MLVQLHQQEAFSPVHINNRFKLFRNTAGEHSRHAHIKYGREHIIFPGQERVVSGQREISLDPDNDG